MNRLSSGIFAFLAVGLVVVVIFVYLDVKSVKRLQYAPIVQLSGGKVRGIVAKVGCNDTVHLYTGIRYGTAERFAKPVPVQPWPGIYDATRWRSACPQFGRLPTKVANTVKQSEDCLYLNVWKPADVKTNRTVMVWIHGGAFEFGTIFDRKFDARYIAHLGDVVVVTINYRLGPLGFMHAGAGYVGNWGLHDQILALKWVQQNIVHFGGDPAQITVFGESAGAMSIGQLMLMQQTSGLFHRAVMQSGGASSACDSPGQALNKTLKLARQVGCSPDDLDQMVQCLKTKSIDQLVKPTVGDLSRNEYFTPVYGDELMPRSPVELTKSTKFNLDLLYGVMKDEGTVFIPSFVPDINSPNLTIDSLKPKIQKLMQVMRQEKYAKEIAEYYTKNLLNPTQDELKIEISNALGDVLFVCPSILQAEQMRLNTSPNKTFYAYRFMQNLSPRPADKQPWMGVAHATDEKFLFLDPYDVAHDTATRRLTRDMIRAWTSFAKCGHPGRMGAVEWVSAFANHSDPITRHLSLHSSNYTIVDGFFRDSCDGFWKQKIFA